MCTRDIGERAPPRCRLRQLNVLTGIKTPGWMFRRFHPGVYVLRQTGSCFSSSAVCPNGYPVSDVKVCPPCVRAFREPCPIYCLPLLSRRLWRCRRRWRSLPFFLHAVESFSTLTAETDDGFATPTIKAGKASVMVTCIKESSCTAVCLSRSQEGEAVSHIDLSVVLRNFEAASAAAFRKTG